MLGVDLYWSARLEADGPFMDTQQLPNPENMQLGKDGFKVITIHSRTSTARNIPRSPTPRCLREKDADDHTTRCMRRS